MKSLFPHATPRLVFAQSPNSTAKLLNVKLSYLELIFHFVFCFRYSFLLCIRHKELPHRHAIKHTKAASPTNCNTGTEQERRTRVKENKTEIRRKKN